MAILHGREDLSCTVTFKWKPEESQGMRYAGIWGKGAPGKDTCIAEPEAGALVRPV